MKKIIFALLAVTLAFSACKKEGYKNTGAKLVAVTFNAGFKQTTGEFQPLLSSLQAHIKTNSVTDTSVTNHISAVYYLVYDADGSLRHAIKQQNTDTLGHFTDHLPEGNYTLAVAAAGDVGTYLADSAKLSTTGIRPSGQLFFNKIALNIGQDAVTQNISLDRVSSRLVVTIKDTIPVGASYISVSIKKAGVAYRISTGANQTPYANVQQFSVTPGSVNSSYIFDYLYISAGDVTIKIVDGNENVLANKTVKNVAGNVNAITTLSGKLFDVSGGIKVNVDTAWKTPINKGF